MAVSPEDNRFATPPKTPRGCLGLLAAVMFPGTSPSEPDFENYDVVNEGNEQARRKARQLDLKRKLEGKKRTTKN